jgi:hypothetical protein
MSESDLGAIWVKYVRLKFFTKVIYIEDTYIRISLLNMAVWAEQV